MKLNYKKTIFVGFAFFLICAFWQAYDNIVPMMLVNKFGLNQTASGVIMSLDNIIALFMLPLFGSLSDKTKTKFGRRTPYIVLGTAVAVCSFFCLTFADNAQLAKFNETRGEAFYSELFEEDFRVTNAEYSVIFNSGAEKTYGVKDYAAMVVKNKKYDELSDAEKAEVKSWYASINKEYSESEKHDAPETGYVYVGNRYYTLTPTERDGKIVFVYMQGDVETVAAKSDVKNAYTNLVTPA